MFYKINVENDNVADTTKHKMKIIEKWSIQSIMLYIICSNDLEFGEGDWQHSGSQGVYCITFDPRFFLVSA